MALTAGELEILITANTKELTQLKNKLKEVQTGSNNTNKSLNKMNGSFNFLKSKALQFGLTLGGVTLALKSMVSKAAEMESMNAQFKIMLGSSAKASEMITKLKKMAAITPFETADLVRNTKVLLQFGVAQEDIMSTLGMLGDVAGASKDRMNRLALVFGQIQSAGRLMGQDLLQLINIGFNPLQIISQKTGKSMATLKDEMSKGLITFDDVKQAFKDATSEGGLFYKNMETQSQTFNGRVSTLKDNIGLVATTIGTALLPMMKEFTESGIKSATAMREFFESSQGIEKISTIAGGLSGTLAVLGEILKDLSTSFGDVVGDVINNFKKDFAELNVTGKEVTIMFKILAGVGKIVAIAFQVIGTGINGIVNQFFNFIKIIKTSAKAIQDVFDTLTGKKKWKDVGSSMEEVGLALKDFVIEPIKNMEEIFDDVKNGFKELPDEAEKNGKKLEDVFNKTSERIKKKVTDSLTPFTGKTEEGESSPPTSQNNQTQKKAVKFELDISAFKESTNKLANLFGSLQDGIIEGFNFAFKNVSDSASEMSEKVKELTEKGFEDSVAKGIKAFEKFSIVFEGIANGIQKLLSGIQEGMSAFYEEQLENLEEQHESEIEAIDERLKKEIELIENNGMTKQERLETDLENLKNSLNSEKNAKKRATLEEEISEKQKELSILNLTEKANKQKNESEKKYAKEKHKREVELFNIKKGLDIANVWISAAAGIVAAWASAAAWPGPSMIAGMALAGVMTGLIATMAGVQTGLIASQQPPPPPKFQTGGIVGGDKVSGDQILARVNSGEMILNPDQQTKLFKQINEGGMGQNINVRVFIGERELREIVSDININNRRATRNR